MDLLGICLEFGLIFFFFFANEDLPKTEKKISSVSTLLLNKQKLNKTFFKCYPFLKMKDTSEWFSTYKVIDILVDSDKQVL